MSNRIEKTATAPGFGGDVTVTLTLEEGKIISCTAEGPNETKAYGDRALRDIPEKIAATGNVQVDAIAGATVTSQAIITAAQAALDAAEGKTIPPVRMKPGKYTASAMGYLGTKELPVTVTVNEGSFLKIETPADRFAHAETEVMIKCISEKLYPRMIESQSLAVDAIAGCTVTSNAIKSAMEKALRQALKEGGSDESAIQNFFIKPPKTELGIVEEKETDILVLGLGHGGIFSMVSAMEKMQELNGLQRINILGIEKAGKLGGNSSLTHECNAVNPPRYMAKFSPDKKFVDEQKYLETWLAYTTASDGTQSAKEDLVKLFFEESGKVIDWLHFEHGWKFGKMEQSPCADLEAWVAYNSILSANQDKGTNEDRRKIMHQYYDMLMSKVIAQGGEYLLETEAYEFIMDGDRVAGVKARNNVTGKEYIIHAKAVIMGCGGFANNEEMLTRLLDKQFAGPRRVTNTGQADGKMLQAALDLGAGTWNIGMSPIVMMKGMDHRLRLFPVNEYEDRLDGRTGRFQTWTLNDIPLGMGVSSDVMCVNQEGKRYGDESKYSFFSRTIKEDSWPSYSSGTHFYAIYSQEQVENLEKNGFTCIPRWDGYCAQGGVPNGRPLPEIYECLDYCIKEGMVFKADSIEGLASQIGVDPAVLTDSVNRYNACVEAGCDSDFGKDARFLTHKTEGGPFYAVKVLNVIFATCGGLDVDTKIRVLRDDHKTPIDGLYATGSDSLGVILNRERNYSGFGGVAQGWVFVSGRIAGLSAAEYVYERFGFSENKINAEEIDTFVNTR